MYVLSRQDYCCHSDISFGNKQVSLITNDIKVLEKHCIENFNMTLCELEDLLKYGEYHGAFDEYGCSYSLTISNR